MKPYIVGICGGSGSGKTYLLKKLLSELPADKITLISQDNYYKAWEDQEKDDEGLVNYDHPDSLRLDLWEDHVQLLMAGESVTKQEYTFNQPDVIPQTFTFQPAPIIVLEGLFIYFPKTIRPLYDLKIFVDAEEHIKLARRMSRDLVERAYSFEETLRDYQKFVAPMYHQYVAPLKADCDLVIPNNDHMNNATRVLLDHLKSFLGREGK